MDRRAAGFVVTEGLQFTLGWRYQPGPHGFDRSDDHRANQHHGHRPALCVEQANHALVAGKQFGDVLCGGLVDREQAARHVDHFPQGTGQRHVHAVVILGRQVDGGELAAHERRGHCRVTAQQLLRAETVALGLEDAAVLDRAKLADGTVGGAQDGARGLVQWAGTRLQGAGEEGIEVLVGAQVLDQRFAHVDLITLGEPGGEGVLEPAHAALGDAAGQPRQQVVRQQVLADDEQTGFHSGSLDFYRRVRVVAPFAPRAGVGLDARVA